MQQLVKKNNKCCFVLIKAVYCIYRVLNKHDMYTKQAVQNKLQQVNSTITRVSYEMKQGNTKEALEYLAVVNEKLEDIQTLLNRETQL